VKSLVKLLEGVPDIEVHICSVGGLGSTFLSNFLNKYGINTNLLKDQDNLRHCPRPPEFHKAISRGIYIFGNMLDSVFSHFRRGHAWDQACKTSGRIQPENMFSSFEAYIEWWVYLCDFF